MTGPMTCIPELIRQRAAMAPDDVALRAGSSRLSYRDLEVRSNRLANYLRGQGVVAGSIVGLCLERSLDFPGCGASDFETRGQHLSPWSRRHPLAACKQC